MTGGYTTGMLAAIADHDLLVIDLIVSIATLVVVAIFRR